MAPSHEMVLVHMTVMVSGACPCGGVQKMSGTHENLGYKTIFSHISGARPNPPPPTIYVEKKKVTKFDTGLGIIMLKAP